MSGSARAHASRSRRLVVCALLTALALTTLGAPPAAAAATVTNCTQANLAIAIAGGGVITLDCGAPTTISITSTLNVAVNTELVGIGDVTLDGGGTTRVLFVLPGVALTLRNLTIANGFDAGQGGGVASLGTLTAVDSAFTGNTSGGSGGAIGSASDAAVTLTNATFSGNTAHLGGAVAILGINPGGGATLTVTNSTFAGNQATNTGGGAQGGAVFSVNAATTLSGSVFNDNHATSDSSSFGGALFASGETLTVSSSTFRDNSATSTSADTDGASSFGGAIFNGGDALTITDSAFSGNGADANASASGGASSFGGAVFNGSDDLTIANSTLSANSADANAASPNASSFGGALFNGSTALTLLNDTIADNRASAGGSLALGEAIFNGSSTTIVANTIVAGSGNAACFGLVPAPSSGHNLASDMSCNFTAAGDQQNVTPAALKLGPLQDNGGPTPTMLPGVGSVAIDAGDDAICAAPPVNNLDQRGHQRPFGAHCDVGAVEVGISSAQASGIAVLRQSCGAQSVTHFCLQWLIRLTVSDGSPAGVTVNAVVDLPNGGQQQLSGVTDKAGGVKFTTPVHVYGTYTLTVTSATVGSTPVPLSGPLTRSIGIGGRFR